MRQGQKAHRSRPALHAVEVYLNHGPYGDGFAIFLGRGEAPLLERLEGRGIDFLVDPVNDPRIFGHSLRRDDYLDRDCPGDAHSLGRFRVLRIHLLHDTRGSDAWAYLIDRFVVLGCGIVGRFLRLAEARR